MKIGEQKYGGKLSVVVGLLISLGAVIVCGCLGLLWLRQSIERTADANRQLESAIQKEERRLRFLDSRIADIHQPSFLQAQVERLGLKLHAPQAMQIVYLEGRPLLREIEKGDAPMRRALPRDPFIRSIDLAVMETFRAGE